MVLQRTKPQLPGNDIRSRYYIISSDCHVVEPSNLWQERIDEQFRHRLPRTEVDEHGRKWSHREGHRPTLIAQIRMEGEDEERAKAGSRNPEERLRDHARDGIDAEVIYPTRGLMIWASNAIDFQAAMCRVYNDWAMEVFSKYRDRMAPAACVAPMDVDGACAEVRRISSMGFRHVMIPNQPGRTPEGRRVGYNHPMFEPLWATIEDCGLPISLHVGTGHDPRTESGPGGAVVNYAIHALAQAQEPISQFCASGILERHPELTVVTVEAGIGWIPWLLWAMDEGYQKHHMWALPKLPMLPSDYWRRQCYGTFQDDPVGVEARHWLGGAGHLMWGNDYPHHEGTWPHSDIAIERMMGDLNDDDRRAMLGGTAAKLYGFEMPAR